MESNRFNRQLFAAIILVCLGALVYSNSLQGSFHFDDKMSIVENPNIKVLSNLRAIWDFWPTRFITYLSIALNYHFNKLSVFGYHLFNLLVHLCSSALVWRLTILTFLTPVMKDKNIARHKNIIAFFTAAVFLAHPLQTQAVNYIIQRAALLAAFFCLISLCLYAKARLSNGPNWKIFYLGSFFAAVISMFTKEMALSLPFLVCAYEFCFFGARKGRNRKYIIPFLAIILVMPFTMLATNSVNLQEMRRAIEPSAGISVGDYFLTQLRVMVTYLRLVLLPVNQNLDYDYPLARSLFSLPVFLSLSLLVTVLSLAARSFNKFRLASFGVFWFFITLLPESSVVPIKDVIFEHRLYLPMAGFSIFIVFWLCYILQERPVGFLIITVSCLVIAYSVASYRRNEVWKNDFSLWSDAVRKAPKKARPYNNRGYAYYKEGKVEPAILDYDQAIRLNPDYPDAFNNRGLAYYDLGDFRQAILDYNKAIEIKPDFADAYNNRGSIYHDKAELDSAIADCDKAIQINPNYADAYYNRANVYHDKGDFAKALTDYSKAIEINPIDADIYYNRGNTYYRVGRMAQAVSDYSKVIEMNTNLANAYLNRALSYFALKEYDKSWEDVKKAQSLGAEVNPYFLNDLKKASSRER